METKYTISILVNNKPGVLVRLAQTFARRAYNVDSLVVSPSHDPNFSRMTVVAQGEPETFDQILRQINKLVDVVHAVHHQSENSVEKEFALFKVRTDSDKRSDVFQIVEVFRAKTIDITETSVIIESTGNTSKIDALERLLSSIGIIEMVRSGKLIMARGAEET
ncbi:acetolactate synthase small subunit [Deltaproteobacteria bacterium TL4]